MSVEETRERVLLIGKCFLGYREGNNNSNKFGDWYGMPNQPWCAMFVSYCMSKAGVSQDVVKKFASCTIGWNWFAARGETRDKNFVPQRGDIIFFDWDPEAGNGMDHVGLVDRVENNTIYTVEGNHDDQVNQFNYPVGSNQIYGFVVPSYTGNEVVENSPDVPSSEMPLLYKGTTGETVKYAQNKLISKGYSVGSYGADGIFGSATEQAVRNFQADNGLSVDGMIGPATWGKLEDSTTVMPSTYPGSVIGMGARGENVVKIQNELMRRGYEVSGGADGQYGSGVKAAVIQFQQDNGLDADGIVGKNTLDALFPQSGQSTYPGYIITMGARGENVVKIQERLMLLGYEVSGGADGQYGSGVRNAVRQFQEDYGLSVDGDVGPETWNALFPVQQTASNYPGYLMGMGMSDSNITLVQKRLSDLGFSVGAIDGIFGEKTKNAVIDFQYSRGLDADGIVGEKTWNALFNITDSSSDSQNPNNSLDDVLTVGTLKTIMKSELVPYLDQIMSVLQKAKSLRTREETFQDLMSYDEIITKYSKLYKVRKSLIQTIIMWEHGVEGIDDLASDVAVREYYENGIDIGKHDSSTGVCQIFASTAIDAINFAVEKGILTDQDKIGNSKEEIGSVWIVLHYNQEANIKYATLNLLKCAYEKNGGYDYDTDPSNIKRILERYNGSGDAAVEHGERNYGLYKLFEKYNEAMRAANS